MGSKVLPGGGIRAKKKGIRFCHMVEGKGDFSSSQEFLPSNRKISHLIDIK
jgi:hypothetical protein